MIYLLTSSLALKSTTPWHLNSMISNRGMTPLFFESDITHDHQWKKYMNGQRNLQNQYMIHPKCSKKQVNLQLNTDILVIIILHVLYSRYKHHSYFSKLLFKRLVKSCPIFFICFFLVTAWSHESLQVLFWVEYQTIVALNRIGIIA